MNILAVDTSTEVCNVCVAQHDRILAEYASRSPVTHTERLMPAIDLLLSHIQLDRKEIQLLAVIHGPGSFTGLRIGLSVVKGLALALQCPVVAANALEIAASQVPVAGLISPAMDARRGEIFTALYKKESDLITTILPPCSIRPEAWIGQLPDEPVHFCGPGAALYWSVLQMDGRSKLWFKDFFLARSLAGYAAGQVAAGKTTSGAELRAAYLRPSDAETKGPRPGEAVNKLTAKNAKAAKEKIIRTTRRI